MTRTPIPTVALATAALLVGTAACTGDPAGEQGASGQRDTLTYALGDEPDTFNPALQDEHTDPVTEMVFRGLTGHDAHNEVAPALAHSWDVTDGGRTYTFHLEEGVTWHDGEPFDAADVQFTINAFRRAGSDVPRSRNFENVTAVETPDRHTVRLRLDEPFAPMLDAVSVGMLPEHRLRDSSITDPEFGRHPIGTGPFALEEYRPGQHAELSAFEDHYDGAPGLDSIVVSYVPDDSARLVRLASGEVDAAAIRPHQAEQARKRAPDTHLEVYPTADYRALMVNFPRMPRLSDPRVRRAMNHAIDREAIVDSVLDGYGEPAHGPLDRSRYANSTEHPFDPTRTATLMRDAGYRKNADGMWERDGETLAFELSTFAEDSTRTAILDVAGTQLREQGFDVDPKPRPGDWVQQHWADLEMFVIGWGSPYDPDTSVYGPFHSSEALAKGGANLGTYANEDVDAALEAGRGARDASQRREAYDRFQQALAADPPFVWVAYLDALNAVPDDLRGPRERTLGHHGYGFFWNVEDWHYEDADSS